MGRPHLTDDERLRVRVLRHDANFTLARISEITGYGDRQIRNALKSATVGKRSGRPKALSAAQEAELVRFVTASKENRSMTYAEIGKSLFDGAHGEYAIRNTLRRLGFKRSGPILKQVTRENEKTRGGAGPAGGAPQGEGDAVAEGTGDAEAPMEGVTGAVPEGDDSATDEEMVMEDEALAEGQSRGETRTSLAAPAEVPAGAPTESRPPVEERLASAVVTAVSETRAEDVASRVQKSAETAEGPQQTSDEDSNSRSN